MVTTIEEVIVEEVIVGSIIFLVILELLAILEKYEIADKIKNKWREWRHSRH